MARMSILEKSVCVSSSDRGPRSWVLGARFGTAPLVLVSFAPDRACRGELVARLRAENVCGPRRCDDARRPSCVRDDTGDAEVAARSARRSSSEGGRMLRLWVVLIQPANCVQMLARVSDCRANLRGGPGLEVGEKTVDLLENQQRNAHGKVG